MLGYLLSPVLQIEDTNGLPLVNGKVYVYEANTSNLATIYSNYEGTYNTNPAILDLAGHTTIIADDSVLYDITIKDADDNLLFSAEDIAVGGEGGSAIVTDVSVQAGNNGITVSQSVVNQTKVFKVFIDYNFVASQSDLALKQDKLSAGPNIDITNNVVSGKDWQDEIDDAVAAVATGFIPYSATNIPAGSSVTAYGDNMLLVGKNITGYGYGNIAVGENLKKTAPNGIIIGSGVEGGANTIAVGENTLAYGYNTLAIGNNISANQCSIVLGGPSISGDYGESTIIVGNNNLSGMGSHNVVLGHANVAESGTDNVIIGRSNKTSGNENIVIGINNSSNSGTIFGGIYNQAANHGYIFGGSYNSATNAAATLNGDGCYASGTGSVAEGLETSALGNRSHAEGLYSIAGGYGSHAEGSAVSALFDNAHAEGIETYASGNASHAEGGSTSALGHESHTEGQSTFTPTAATYSHAEGYGTSAMAPAAHAEGDHTVAFGVMSHAEGGYTTAYGNCSHAEGSDTQSVGLYSHAEGKGTTAAGDYQTVIGKYNYTDDHDIFQVGCGEYGSPANAMTVDVSGSVNVNTSTGLKNTRTFFDNLGEVSYYHSRSIPVFACTGTDYEAITTTGATGYYATCPQTFTVPNARKVKVDGFYQIKGGMNVNGTVPNFQADPKIQFWANGTQINTASLTNGSNLPRSVPIPFSFVTGGTTSFKVGFCTEGTWTATNMDNDHGGTAGNLLINYTTTILDQE